LEIDYKKKKRKSPSTSPPSPLTRCCRRSPEPSAITTPPRRRLALPPLLLIRSMHCHHCSLPDPRAPTAPHWIHVRRRCSTQDPREWALATRLEREPSSRRRGPCASAGAGGATPPSVRERERRRRGREHAGVCLRERRDEVNDPITRCFLARVCLVG
jgi:hypothetical protein